jgi:hypothetical protein
MPQSAVHFLPIMGACCFGGIGSSETSTRVFILHSTGSSSLPLNFPGKAGNGILEFLT